MCLWVKCGHTPSSHFALYDLDMHVPVPQMFVPVSTVPQMFVPVCTASQMFVPVHAISTQMFVPVYISITDVCSCACKTS